MLQKEDIEAVIMAPPLWAHADLAVGCLDAGKHVLCEKMMAGDVAGCERMRERRAGTGKVLEIGYQRTYNAMYQAAYDGLDQDRVRSATSITSVWPGIATATGVARASRRRLISMPRSGATRPSSICSTGVSTGSTRRD